MCHALQAYFIFAIGNLRPIFNELYPDCFATHTACSSALVASQTYVQARLQRVSSSPGA